MRVLLVSQHYWPETVGTARRVQLLGEWLVSRGHTVEVLCGWPNHPSMARYFSPEYQGSSSHNGVLIHRVAIYRTALRNARTSLQTNIQTPLTEPRPPAAGMLMPDLLMPWLARAHRLATYGTWVARGLLETLLERTRWDVIVAVSPLPTGVIGAVIAMRHQLPLVFDLQDIWPEAAVQAGLFTRPAFVTALERVERLVYEHSRALVVLSEGFKQNLILKGVPANRIHVLPNSVELEPHVNAEGGTLRKELGLAPADTLVIYAGNMGVMQDLDVLLEAADGLRAHRNIRFLLVGEGIDKERLRRLSEAKGLTQVRFMEPQPSSRVPELLAAADICFLSLRDGAYMPGTIPSKLYEYLAAGRPILNLVEGDAALSLDTAEAGINLPPGDPLALRVALFGLHADPGLRRKMGTAGRRYVGRLASIEVVGQRYEDLLDQVSSTSV